MAETTRAQLIFALNVARAIARRQPHSDVIVNFIDLALHEAKIPQPVTPQDKVDPAPRED